MPVRVPARVPPEWPGREYSREVLAAGLSWHVQHVPAAAAAAAAGPTAARTLLLLHGTGASAHSFAPMLPFLSRALPGAHIVVPDLPGHGFTLGAALPALTLPRIATDLGALMAALELPPLIGIAGHSAGAALALRMVLDGLAPEVCVVGFNPSLVAMPTFYMQVVAPLINPVATSGPVTALIAKLAGRTRLIDRLLDSTGSRLNDAQRSPYRRLFANATHVRGSVGFMAAADLPALLQESARLTVPCRFVIGEADAWVQPRALRPLLARHYATATIETWPGGHLLHELEPERAAAVIAAAVDSATGRTAKPDRAAASAIANSTPTGR